MIRIWTLLCVMTISGLAAAQEARPLAENQQAEARLKALAVNCAAWFVKTKRWRLQCTAG